MKRILRWLQPNSFLSGSTFGFVFGFVALQALFVALSVDHDYRFKSLSFHLSAGSLFAIPWVIIWGASGAARGKIPGHPATLATLASITVGFGYSFWEGPKHLHPWLPITVPVYTVLAFIPCHLIGLVIFMLFKRTLDPEWSK